MADRIPTYIDTVTQRISEIAAGDSLDASDVKLSTINGDAYPPASKLDADKIWTGTQTEYDNLSPDTDTLYFIV
jgi:hypothetical protein